MSGRGRVVVLGVLGQSPFAGMGWQVLHYLEAFRRLEWDVWYVEDTGEWPYDPVTNTVSADCSYSLGHIAGSLARCHLEERWVYRSAAEDGRLYGPGASSFASLLSNADLLVNVTGATVLRDEHMAVPARLYLETDPVLPQIEVAKGNAFTIEVLEAHTHWATFGENLGQPDCGVPVPPFAYVPTRQPVVVDWWADLARPAAPAAAGDSYTTVASWKQTSKDIEWNGERYTWSKDVAFAKVLDLPAKVDRPLELALATDDDDAVSRLRDHGWRVVPAIPLSLDLDDYRSYVAGSRGEFTVAKDQYARLRSGWFSDRSACYLAAGRPVVTQDTGFGRVIPTGEGLFAFSDLDDAATAISEIERDYERHSSAAAGLARSHFEATTVVSDLLTRLSL
jgi:hypothetical protein